MADQININNEKDSSSFLNIKGYFNFKSFSVRWLEEAESTEGSEVRRSENVHTKIRVDRQWMQEQPLGKHLRSISAILR